MPESFRSRWLLGLQFGLLAWGIPSVWVTVAHVVTGGSALRAMGLSLWVVLLVYFSGALLGSLVFGVAAPLFRSRIGAGVGGFIVAIPLFVAVAISLPGESLATPETWRAIAFSAAFLGGLGGLLYWDPD